MRIRKRMVLPMALALGSLGMMVMATVAGATHPRPAGADPLRASLVPAYEACPAGNRIHGPPLAFVSCNPPGQTSSSLTVGTPDANGAGAKSVGFIDFGVVVGTPGPPDDSDVNIEVNITDVRCKAGVAACGSANAADGADYTGEMEASWQLRASDHFNAVSAGGGTDPATVIDVPGYFTGPVVMPCVSTLDILIGGTCAIETTANALVPGAVKDGKRTIEEFGQIQVFDGGADGVSASDPNTLFSVQGIFIP